MFDVFVDVSPTLVSVFYQNNGKIFTAGGGRKSKMSILNIAAWLLLNTPVSASDRVLISASDEEFKELATRLRDGMVGTKRICKEVLRWVSVQEHV